MRFVLYIFWVVCIHAGKSMSRDRERISVKKKNYMFILYINDCINYTKYLIVNTEGMQTLSLQIIATVSFAIKRSINFNFISHIIWRLAIPITNSICVYNS